MDRTHHARRNPLGAGCSERARAARRIGGTRGNSKLAHAECWTMGFGELGGNEHRPHRHLNP